MTQKKQGLTSRGAKKRTAPVKRYADGDEVNTSRLRELPVVRPLWAGTDTRDERTGLQQEQARTAAGEGLGGQLRKLNGPSLVTTALLGETPVRQNSYTTSAQADRELGARQPAPMDNQPYPNVGNAGDAKFNADRGQLSFTDKNFDPTKQQFADGTGAITGRGGRTVVYSGMGPGQQPGQQGLSSAGPQPAGGGSNPYAAGTSEHNLFNYGGKNAVTALNTTRQGGAGGGTNDMARQLADLSAQRMGAAQGGDGPSVTMLHSSTPPMTLTPYRPLGGGMTHGLIPASQRHAEASMYNTDMNAQMAAAANQTALRGQDMGMQSHLQGLDLSGQYSLQNTGLQGRNQLQNTMLQGQNQQQAQALHNMGQLGLEEFKAGTPLSKANAEYSKAHAGLAGAQQRAINVGLQNENIAQKQISDIANVIRQTPEGMNLRPAELLEAAREQHKLNQPRGGQPDTAHAFNSLQPTPEERQEFQRTGKLPARLAAAAAGHAQGYADGGPVQPAPKETPEQIMARMANKYGVAAPQQPAPAPRPQTPPPQQGGLSSLPDTIRNRNEELRRITNYADGGPIAVGGRQVTDLSGRMDHTGSDSLPAVIDGDPAHPAALTSGEFVFPVEAVQHYGTDRLRKMVAAARKGGPLATGRQAA